MQIYDEIVKKKMVMPVLLKDPAGIHFLKKILNKNPNKRFKGSYENLKSDKFFKHFKWVIKYFCSNYLE